jgi:hypothetical protein
VATRLMASRDAELHNVSYASEMRLLCRDMLIHLQRAAGSPLLSLVFSSLVIVLNLQVFPIIWLK